MDGPKRMMNANHQDLLTIEIPANKSPGSSFVKPTMLSKPVEETEVEDNQHMKEEEIPTNISNAELLEHNENTQDLSSDRVKLGADGIDEKDILQVTIHSDICAAPADLEPSVLPKLEREEIYLKNEWQIKEEEIPVNITEDESIDMHTPGHHHSSYQSINFDSGKKDVTKLYQEEIRVNLTSEYGSKSAKKLACSDCGKCFSYSLHLLNHQRIHTGEKPFACSVCGKCFSQNSHLVTHHKIHTGEKPFACSECGKSFTQKTNLISHQKIHSNEKPFTCLECGKCFTQNSHLVTHQKIHTGKRPFACFQCGKCFNQRSALVTHKIVHTGEKPFTCSDCGKCFGWKSDLVIHQKIHTDDKPFTCTDCGKCFRRNANLMIHMRVHTGVKPYICSECGKGFGGKSNLIRHQRIHINDKSFL